MFPALAPHFISIDDCSTFYSSTVSVAVLRLDKIHPIISGNKWFKLRYYLEEAKARQSSTIITFGGAWSNHIVATAAACQQNNINAIGIIRGEEPGTYSTTLLQAKEYGMQLVFVSREAYKNKQIPDFIDQSNSYIINEGGYGAIGAKGAATIIYLCGTAFTHYCCATGTGTMLAGLINALPIDKKITGISVLKNNRELQPAVQKLLKKDVPDWELLHDYHYGGYAKQTPSLLQFMNAFYSATGIPSDIVYTGKLFYAVQELIQKNYFPPGSNILLIHSGGLQGNSSLPKGTLIF